MCRGEPAARRSTDAQQLIALGGAPVDIRRGPQALGCAEECQTEPALDRQSPSQSTLSPGSYLLLVRRGVLWRRGVEARERAQVSEAVSRSPELDTSAPSWPFLAPSWAVTGHSFPAVGRLRAPATYMNCPSYDNTIPSDLPLPRALHT